MEIRFSPSARSQFLDAIEKIQENNQSPAENFRNKVEAGLKYIAAFPNSGPSIAEFPNHPHRELFIKPYRFFYRVEGETLWVVAVWHGAQLPKDPRLFSDT